MSAAKNPDATRGAASEPILGPGPAEARPAMARDTYRRSLVVVLVIASLLRISILAFWPLPPVVLDAAEYDTAARRLLAVGSYAFPQGTQAPLTGAAFSAFIARKPNGGQMPGYPLFLAAIYRVLGTGPERVVAVAWVQALLGVLTVLLTAACVRRTGSRREALAAALIAALYLPFVWVGNAMLTQTLYTLALAGVAYLGLRAIHDRSLWWFAALGAALALSSYVRPETLPWAVVLFAVALAFSAPDIGWRAALAQWLPGFAVACAVVLALLAPWAARNAVIYHRFVPFGTYNSAPSNDFDRIALHLPPLELDPRLDSYQAGTAVASAHRALVSGLSPQTKVRLYALRGWESARSWLVPFDPTWTYTRLGTGAAATRTLWFVLPQVALVAFACVGVWAGRRRVGVLALASVPVYFLVLHAATYPASVYAQPSMAAMIGLAGIGSVAMAGRLRRRRLPRLPAA